jgi:predicted dehydrogenase
MADDVIGLVQSFYGCNVSLTRGLRSWFYDKAKSGGALVDQATHNLDLLRSLMGEVAEVRGLSANPYTPKGPGYTIEELIALSFRFRSGALGAHVHTWLGDRWRNEMVFSGRKRVYRLDLGRGSLTIDEGPETRRFQQEQDRMFVYQNERFIEMLTSGDWGGNPCSYDDGLATLELTEECDRAATGGA